MDKKGITETTIYYIIAVALGITVVIIYILLVGPNAIVKDLASFFGSFTRSTVGALNSTS